MVVRVHPIPVKDHRTIGWLSLCDGYGNPDVGGWADVFFAADRGVSRLPEILVRCWRARTSCVRSSWAQWRCESHAESKFFRGVVANVVEVQGHEELALAVSCGDSRLGQGFEDERGFRSSAGEAIGFPRNSVRTRRQTVGASGFVVRLGRELVRHCRELVRFRRVLVGMARVYDTGPGDRSGRQPREHACNFLSAHGPRSRRAVSIRSPSRTWIATGWRRCARATSAPPRSTRRSRRSPRSLRWLSSTS
jgi:hypothetical protein